MARSLLYKKQMAKWKKASFRTNLERVLSDGIASYVDYLGLNRLIKPNHNMK